jgi:hypothetical protein
MENIKKYAVMDRNKERVSCMFDSFDIAKQFCFNDDIIVETNRYIKSIKFSVSIRRTFAVKYIKHVELQLGWFTFKKEIEYHWKPGKVVHYGPKWKPNIQVKTY